MTIKEQKRPWYGQHGVNNRLLGSLPSLGPLIVQRTPYTEARFWVTTTDGTNNAIVWVADVGGDGRLRGYDGDTGAVIFAGGGPNEQMANTRQWNTGMVARGRIYFGADNKIYAFRLPTGTPTPTPALSAATATVANFNGDGHPDYVLRNASTRQTAIWYLNNNVFVNSAYGPTAPPGWSLVGR